MYIDTAAGKTNTLTGEIIDLSPLRTAPRKTTKHPVRRYKARKSQAETHLTFVALVSTLVMWISFAQ